MRRAVLGAKGKDFVNTLTAVINRHIGVENVVTTEAPRAQSQPFSAAQLTRLRSLKGQKVKYQPTNSKARHLSTDRLLSQSHLRRVCPLYGLMLDLRETIEPAAETIT
uniref:Uncharacterized protein n=1 Tax=Glossina austeni TaxID=7395 RepID=A0A1A9UEW1_GLOAU